MRTKNIPVNPRQHYELPEWDWHHEYNPVFVSGTVPSLFPKAWYERSLMHGHERRLRACALNFAATLVLLLEDRQHREERKEKSRTPLGSLYVFRMVFASKPEPVYGPYKVGWSQDPVKRLYSLAQASPYGLECCGELYGIEQSSERGIHNDFQRSLWGLHIQGEWYTEDMGEVLSGIPREGAALNIKGTGMFAIGGKREITRFRTSKKRGGVLVSEWDVKP